MMKTEDKIQRMNALGSQIIEVSVKQVNSGDENPKHRLSADRQRRQSKNALISELMTLLSECRKMDLSQADREKLDAAITRLNEKLYEATSLTIL